MNYYDIPKELWFVVDRLYRTGMQKPLFSQSGLNEEILQIRDWLDEIPNSSMRKHLFGPIQYCWHFISFYQFSWWY